MLHHLLAIRHVSLPNPVAAHDDEIVVGTALGLCDFRQRCHCLLFVGPIREVLVLEVPKRAREGERAVDSALFHVSSCFFYSVLFGGNIGLVVGGERNCLVSPAENGPRVPDIGHIVSVLGHEDHNGGGSSSVADLLSFRSRYAQPFSDDSQLLLSSVAEQHVVDALEHVGEGLRVILQLEIRLIQKLLRQSLSDVVGDLGPAVSVEHSEEIDSVSDFLAESGVFHGSSPS